jgi:hypothetical protein
VIRRALAIYRTLRDLTADGGTVTLTRPDGTTERLVIL